MSTYLGLAYSDSMVMGRVVLTREEITAADVPADVISCLNPSHTATIDAMRVRFGLEIALPEKPPIVALKDGDVLIVLGVRGLPRLTDRHQYTPEEIAGATFVFARYTVASA